MDEKALIISAKSGDTKAFTLLVERYYSEIYHTALGIMRSKWDALDVCQETFTKAFSSMNTLKDNTLFRPWLNRILVNSCYDHFRRNKGLILVEDIEAEGFSEGERVEELDVLKALAALSEETRATLSLRYFQDLKIADIASIMGCPEGTIKSRISNGLKKLREIMTAGESREVIK